MGMRAHQARLAMRVACQCACTSARSMLAGAGCAHARAGMLATRQPGAWGCAWGPTCPPMSTTVPRGLLRWCGPPQGGQQRGGGRAGAGGAGAVLAQLPLQLLSAAAGAAGAGAALVVQWPACGQSTSRRSTSCTACLLPPAPTHTTHTAPPTCAPHGAALLLQSLQAHARPGWQSPLQPPAPFAVLQQQRLLLLQHAAAAAHSSVSAAAMPPHGGTAAGRNHRSSSLLCAPSASMPHLGRQWVS